MYALTMHEAMAQGAMGYGAMGNGGTARVAGDRPGEKMGSYPDSVGPGLKYDRVRQVSVNLHSRILSILST